MSETQIVDRARAGDKDAFGDLYELHKNFVWNVAYRMVYDFDEAEDIAQDVFVTAWKNIGSFQGGSKFSTWLYKITVNKTLNRLRGNRRTRELSGEAVYNMIDEKEFLKSNPGAALEDVETERALAKLLGELDPEKRMAVILREIMGLSYEEIAKATDSPVGTVRSRISRGRARLSELAEKMEQSK